MNANKVTVTVIQELREELVRYADQKYHETAEKFSQEEVARIRYYGVKTPVTRKISSHFFTQIRRNSKEDILELCETLLKSGYSEERTIAFDWAFRLKKQYSQGDFSLFESWLKTYVTGWGSCDDFCIHAFGEFIYQFPEYVKDVGKWAVSDNKWLRRASAVVLIYSIRRDALVDYGFQMADILLLDQDVMVQKGYGWMLKEISNIYPHKVFEYVMANKERMPRTSLRYAIEKLNPELRKIAMQ